MADKDSSYLFSLEQIMSLEERRLQEEEAARRRQAEKARAEALAAAERARAEEARRLREDDARRQAEQARIREEQARLEAIRAGEMERARLLVEHQTRLEAELRREEHAETMRRLGANRKGRGLGGTVVASAAFGLLSLAVALGVYYGKIKPEADELARVEQLRIDAEREELVRRQAVIDRQNADLDRMRRQVDEVREDAGLPPSTPTGARSAHSPPPRVPSVPGISTNAGPGPCKCIDPMDPMCGCIQPH